MSKKKTPSVALDVHRTFRADLDLRASKRIVVGRAIPYGNAEMVSDDGLSTYLEEWQSGVFRSAVLPANAGRVKLNYTHNDDTMLEYWIGRTLLLEEKPDGLYGEWKVDDSPFGDAVLYKVRDGQLPGLSVSARIHANMMRGDVKVRTDAQLRHVALVEVPAFTGALVTAMRGGQAGRDDQPPVPVEPEGPRKVDGVTEWLKSRRAEIHTDR